MKFVPAGLFVITLLVTSMLAVALSPYDNKLALDTKGVINVQPANSFFLSQCTQDVSDEQYASELYGKVIFQGAGGLSSGELLAKCGQPNGVDEIVSLVDERTKGKDLSGLCSELDDSVARCENSKDSCEQIKEKSEDFTCPPDATKMVELCKQRFQNPVDNCDEEYARSKEKIGKYCNGIYKPSEVVEPISPTEQKYYEKPKYSQEEEAHAREKCARYGGDWRNGGCDLPDKPISERGGECPKVYRENFQCPNGARVVEKTYNNYGHLCIQLDCDYAERPLSSDQTCSRPVAVPNCPTSQHSEVSGRDSAGCPNSYRCAADATSGSCPASVMNEVRPNCPAGQYAQAQSGQNTPCPYNYQCVPNDATGSGSGTSSGACTSNTAPLTVPTCSSGQHSQAVYSNGGSCPTSYACIADTTPSGGSGSGSSCPPSVMNEVRPNCPAGQYAQAQSGQNTPCPYNYQCVSNSGSGSGSGSSQCDPSYCPPEPSLPSCGVNQTIAENHAQYTPAGCSAAHDCVNHYCATSVQRQSASTISGFAVETAATSAAATSATTPASTTASTAQPAQPTATTSVGTTVPQSSQPVSTAGPYDYCTKEGFLKKCRSALYYSSQADDSFVGSMCEYQVKRNLPFLEQFCKENSANLYGKCRAQASQTCTCLKQKATSCKTFANRDKFLLLVRDKAALECKKYLLREKKGGEAISQFEDSLRDAPIEDRAAAGKAVETITLTTGQLEEIKRQAAEEAKRDAFLTIKKLLGLQSNAIEQRIAELTGQLETLKQARSVMDGVCVKLAESDQSSCIESLDKLKAQESDVEKQIADLQSDKNGFLGAIGGLFGNLFNNNAQPTATTTASASGTSATTPASSTTATTSTSASATAATTG